MWVPKKQNINIYQIYDKLAQIWGQIIVKSTRKAKHAINVASRMARFGVRKAKHGIRLDRQWQILGPETCQIWS